MSSIGPNILRACRGLLDFGQYRASSVLARHASATCLDPGIMPILLRITKIADTAQNILDSQAAFVCAHTRDTDRILFNRVYSPIEGSLEKANFQTVFRNVDFLSVSEVNGLGHDVVTAIFEQALNTRHHAGGGILSAVRRETEKGPALYTFTYDLGPGIENVAILLERSIRAHADNELWGVPGAISGMGTLNMFQHSDEFLIDSRGTAWTKDPSNPEQLVQSQGLVKEGTCTMLGIYLKE